MNYIKNLWDLWNLKRNEKKSAAEISALQDKKRKKLLHYAYEHSSYYRNSFEHAGITADTMDDGGICFPCDDACWLHFYTDMADRAHCADKSHSW